MQSAPKVAEVASTVIQVSGLCGDVAVAAVMVAKKLHRRFPWFFLFMAFQVAQDIILLEAVLASPVYFDSSYLFLQYGTGAALMVLGLLAIPEGMRDVPSPKSRTFSRVSATLFGAYVALVVVPVAALVVRQAARNVQGLQPGLVAEMEEFFYICTVLRLGLAIVCASATQLFRLRWSTYALCLVLGFALNDACLATVLSNWWVDFPAISDPALLQLRIWVELVIAPGMYWLTLAAWLWGVLHKSRPGLAPAGTAHVGVAIRQLKALKVSVAAFQPASTGGGDPSTYVEK